jgi:hypothetical protein
MQNSQKSKISGIESSSMIDTDNKNNEILDFIFNFNNFGSSSKPNEESKIE